MGNDLEAAGCLCSGWTGWDDRKKFTLSRREENLGKSWKLMKNQEDVLVCAHLQLGIMQGV